MTPTFREEKTTQIASRLLETAGGRMNILKLVKLVYLVDRTSLVKYGRPVTFDRFFAMKQGPVVNSTLDCINAVREAGEAPIWMNHISERRTNAVTLLRAAEPLDLSTAEERIIDEVCERFGAMSEWELRDWTHQSLPEYREPHEAKRTPITYEDVLTAAGWDQADIAEAILQLDMEDEAQRALSD